MLYQIQNFINILIHNRISFKYQSPYEDGSQIIIEHNNQKYSVVCNPYSYGHENGLLEVWNFSSDNDVFGWKTAEEVWEIISENLPFPTY